MARVLVTGGIRSGKSAHAEALLGDRDRVSYLACGPGASDEDPAWSERVRQHQQRRPSSWTTVESVDLPAMIDPATPTLIDSLGTWLAAQLDELGAWSGTGWEQEFEARLNALVLTVSTATDLVFVSDEVGLGGVAPTPAGRLFADLLGSTNQRIAAVCDEVHLVVAGRVLRL